MIGNRNHQTSTPSRVHIAFSPECPNFLRFLEQPASFTDGTRFLFLEGDSQDIDERVAKLASFRDESRGPVAESMRDFHLCHFHWSFEPEFFEFVAGIAPEPYVLVSFLLDDYQTSNNLPGELVSFADEIVLEELPAHLESLAGSIALPAYISSAAQSSTLLELPAAVKEGRFRPYPHVWSHNRVGSILHSPVNRQDPRFSGKSPDGHWYFSQIFPHLEQLFRVSRQSLYPDQVLEADESIRLHANTLLDFGIEKFQQHFPEDPHLRYWLGLCLVESGDLERADYLLSSVTQIKHPWRIPLLRGVLQKSRGESDLAIEHFSEVLSQFPECKQAKEGMRALVLHGDSPQLFFEEEDTEEGTTENGNKSVIVSVAGDSQIFEILEGFLRGIIRDDSLLVSRTARDLYRRLFYLPVRSRDRLRFILCNEPVSDLSTFLNQDIKRAFMVSKENSDLIERELSEKYDSDILGTVNQLAESLFLLGALSGLQGLSYLEIPGSNNKTFERLDASADTRKPLEMADKWVRERLLSLSPREQSRLDFYRRSLPLYSDLLAAAPSSICDEYLQILLQNNLRHIGAVSSREDLLESLQVLWELANEKTNRQVLFSPVHVKGPSELRELLESAEEIARFKQFDYIALADNPAENQQIRLVLEGHRLNAKKIILAF